MDEKIAQILQYPFSDKIQAFYKKIIFISILTCGAILLAYHTPVSDVIKYIGFQIIYVFLPGAFLYRLFRLKMDTSLFLIWTYALGVAFVIVQFIICASVKCLPALYYIGPIMSVIEIYLARKADDRLLTIDLFRRLPIQFWFIYSLLLLITGFGLTLANPQPELLRNASYGQDILWMIGNAEALLKKFLPYDLRLSGVIFKYHFFGAVYWASIHYVTNIELFTIVYKLYSIGNLFLIAGSVYVLGKTIVKETRLSLLFTWVYFFTSCASMLFTIKNGYGIFFNVNFAHLGTDPFGYEIALPIYLLTIALCTIQLNKNKVDAGSFGATMLLLFVCTGAKGPSGFMIFGSLLVALLGSIVLHRTNRSILWLTLSAVITGLFVYFVFIQIPGSGNSLSVKPAFTVENTILGAYVSKVINSNAIRSIFNNVLIPVHFLCFLPFVTIPFGYWCIQKLSKYKCLSLLDIFIGSLAISGITLTYLLAQSGNSQLYFIMFAIPIIELIAIIWLQENYHCVSITIKRLLVFLFVVATISSFFTVLYDIKEGIKGIVHVYQDKYTTSQPSWNTITSYEYDAMKWLRENTNPYSMIAGDRWYYDSQQGSSRYFYYSTFSGRQFFLEGWDYTNKSIANNVVPSKLEVIYQLYSDKIISKNDIMKQQGIDYIVVSRFIHPDSKMFDFDESLELVFANNDIRIYRCREQ